MITTTRLFIIGSLLFACSKVPQHRWCTNAIEAECSRFNSIRLCLPVNERVSPIGLEIFGYAEGVDFYVTTTGRTFCLSDPNAPNVLGKLTSGDEEISFTALRLEGGQKIKLPQAIADELISSLLENEPCVLSIGQYHVDITPKGFSTGWNQLSHLRT